MQAVLRSPVTIVWFILVVATIVSWALGAGQGFSDDGRTMASVVLLLVAFAKVRFIGLYFMELRDAPISLRGAIEAYCIGVCAMTVTMFLVH